MLRPTLAGSAQNASVKFCSFIESQLEGETSMIESGLRGPKSAYNSGSASASCLGQ